jgi:hypothetical protein
LVTPQQAEAERCSQPETAVAFPFVYQSIN